MCGLRVGGFYTKDAMKTIILTTAIIATSANSHEAPKLEAPQRDTWNGAPAHIAGSAIAGLACSTHIYPGEQLKAFGCAMVPGVLKEVIDSRQAGNHFSTKDLISDAVGAALGVTAGNFMLQYHNRGVKLSYSIPIQ